MSQFKLGAKIVELFNKYFGSNIELADQDDVTLYDELKGSAESYAGSIQKQISDLQAKADAHDSLQGQVTQLTADLEAERKKTFDLDAKVTIMQKDFEAKLMKLREDVRAEIAKEGETKSGEGLQTLNDTTGNRPKQLVINDFAETKAPIASVGN